MTKVLDIESRKKIYTFIEKNPGLNLTTIAEMLKISVGLVNYHTQYLENHGFLTIVKEEGFKRYYVKGKTGLVERKFFSVLRQEIPLKIVLFLLEHPHSNHREIVEQFDLAPSTVSYHLSKLVKLGIVSASKSGEERGYTVVNVDEVVRFLIRYKPSKVLKRFEETWTGFHIP